MLLLFAVTNDELAVIDSGGTNSMEIFESGAPFSQYATTVPQAPQLSGSCCVSTQLLLHCVTGHGSQPPFLHTSFAAQALPQAPQLSRSFSRSFCCAGPPSGALPQVEKPGATQAPFWQLVGMAQTTPQPPQLALSESTALHAVWPGVEGHWSWPAGQLVHWPAVHVCCGAQTWPQAPQLTGSNEVSVQASPDAPASARALHNPRGAAQEGWQSPPTQAVAPPAGT
jgi:hypothetical protein